MRCYYLDVKIRTDAERVTIKIQFPFCLNKPGLEGNLLNGEKGIYKKYRKHSINGKMFEVFLSELGRRQRCLPLFLFNLVLAGLTNIVMRSRDKRK